MKFFLKRVLPILLGVVLWNVMPGTVAKLIALGVATAVISVPILRGKYGGQDTRRRLPFSRHPPCPPPLRAGTGPRRVRTWRRYSWPVGSGAWWHGALAWARPTMAQRACLNGGSKKCGIKRSRFVTRTGGGKASACFFTAREAGVWT